MHPHPDRVAGVAVSEETGLPTRASFTILIEKIRSGLATSHLPQRRARRRLETANPDSRSRHESARSRHITVGMISSAKVFETST
jgi:hypothetical protein